MTWHVDAMTAAQYSVGATDAADAASVEAHLMACDECRTVINAYADDAVLAAVWADDQRHARCRPTRVDRARAARSRVL